MVTYFATQMKKEPVLKSVAHLVLVAQNISLTSQVESFVTETLGWPHAFDHPDIHLVNPDLKPISIDQIRQLQQQLVYPAIGKDGQFFILFNLDGSSIPAQNALLKTLEEPPAAVCLVVTASSLSPILATIQSRCVIHSLISQAPISEPAEQTAVGQTLAASLNLSSWAQLIELSETLTDKTSAIATLEAVIKQKVQDLERQPTARITRQLQILQTAVHQLQRNTNVRLTMESVLFGIKKTDA